MTQKVIKSLSYQFSSVFSLLQDRIKSLADMETIELLEKEITIGEEKTTNYDVSTLVGDGTGTNVASIYNNPYVSAMMISIILNIVNFAIIYYQVR